MFVFTSQNGDFIKKSLTNISNSQIVTRKDVPTANCSVLFDKDGECQLIALDLKVHRTITPDLITQKADLLKEAPLIVFDANLSIEAMEAILTIASENERPVFYEPTDMRIAQKPFVVHHQLHGPIKFVSPNLYELRSMAKFLGFANPRQRKSLDPAFIGQNEQEILVEVTELAQFMSDKLENMLITLGKKFSPFRLNHHYLVF